MNWQQSTKLILLIIVISTTTIFGQNIYPGDVNNNGVVNGVDFLYLANAYNETGTSRNSVSTTYSPIENSTDWDNDFPNGVNHSFADCNGDGKVSNKDISQGIIRNFGKTHGSITDDNYIEAPINTSPSLIFTSITGEDNTVYIDVSLDANSTLIEDFYGITFDVEFAENIVLQTSDLSSSSVAPISYALPVNAWFAENPRNKRHITVTRQNDDGGLVTTVAISRIDGAPASGQDSMGQFRVITENIELFRTSTQLFEVKNVMVVRHDLSIIPVTIVQ